MADSDSMTRAEFLARIKALGFRSQAQFAELFGFNPMTVYQWGSFYALPVWVPVMLASWEALQAVHGAEWMAVLLKRATS